MSRLTQMSAYLERSAQDSALRRAIAARLDRALRRAGVSSARAATWLAVSAEEVQFWRRGITVPPVPAFTRLAAILGLDIHWLCTGQSPLHLAS
jgi:hypothetical protein